MPRNPGPKGTYRLALHGDKAHGMRRDLSGGQALTLCGLPSLPLRNQPWRPDAPHACKRCVRVYRSLHK